MMAHQRNLNDAQLIGRSSGTLLSLHCLYHDSAAALLQNGKILAAAQEERFSRKKFDAATPIKSMRFCLNAGGLKLSQIDEIVYYEKPFLSFERILETQVSSIPFSLPFFLKSMPVWIKQKLNTRLHLEQELSSAFPDDKIPPILFSEHHLSHAASAFYPSPFESACVLCLDGVGEWATTSGWMGKGRELKPIWEIHFPHSVGLLYSTFTAFCGFKVNSGEYKLMGLAPYGKPIYADKIKKQMVYFPSDGSFGINQKYFSYLFGNKMYNREFEKFFGLPPRAPESAITQPYRDLAASIQVVIEEIIIRLAKKLQHETDAKFLCLAGGVALNCVANGVLHREKIFEDIWVQPAAGDSGGALGAALASHYIRHSKTRTVNFPDSMSGAYLGPSFTKEEIESLLLESGVKYVELGEEDLLHKATEDLKDQKVIAWFQGRMEYGPRALGSRSILGDPRSPQMQSIMNQKIKFRESFRPFAPIIKAEKTHDLYENAITNSYMLFVMKINEKYKNEFPAVTHIDGSARVQAVFQNQNPLLWKLLDKFETATKCPILINTSFNVRGEPIVCSPEEALRCFVHTDIESLCMGNFYIMKSEQDLSHLREKWEPQHGLD